MKNILIINGYPDKESFYYAFAYSYRKGAESAGAKSKVIHLNDLKFNSILTFGYRKILEISINKFIHLNY